MKSNFCVWLFLIKNRGLLLQAAPDGSGWFWACCYATMAAWKLLAVDIIAVVVARFALIIYIMLSNEHPEC